MFLGGGCDTGERPCHVRVGVYGTWASMDYAVQGAPAPRSGRIRVRAVEPRHPHVRSFQAQVGRYSIPSRCHARRLAQRGRENNRGGMKG